LANGRVNPLPFGRGTRISSDSKRKHKRKQQSNPIAAPKLRDLFQRYKARKRCQGNATHVLVTLRHHLQLMRCLAENCIATMKTDIAEARHQGPIVANDG